MIELFFTEPVIELAEWLGEENMGRINSLPRAALVLESVSEISDLQRSIDQFDRVLVISRDFNDGRIFSLGRILHLSGFESELALVGALIANLPLMPVDLIMN